MDSKFREKKFLVVGIPGNDMFGPFSRDEAMAFGHQITIAGWYAAAMVKKLSPPEDAGPYNQPEFVDPSPPRERGTLADHQKGE